MARFEVRAFITIDAEDAEQAQGMVQGALDNMVGGDILEAYAEDADQVFPEEYDGQPDEAQEWHDFDPDC